jgi:hypothetical protein
MGRPDEPLHEHFRPNSMTDQSSSDGDEVTRRWLIRLLVGLGIGIPVAIEGVTFIGLFTDALLGDDEDDDETATPTQTPEPTVGVGDELLPPTAPVETVREMRIRVEGSAWQFELTVDVENTTETPYSLRLGEVRTGGGRSVAGSASTDRIPPGETETITGTWSLSENQFPSTVSVTGLTYGDGDPLTTTRQVPLGQVPLRG